MAVSKLSFQPPLPSGIQNSADNVASRINSLEKKANDEPKKIQKRIDELSKKIDTLSKFLLGPFGKKLDPARKNLAASLALNIQITASLKANATACASAYAGISAPASNDYSSVLFQLDRLDTSLQKADKTFEEKLQQVDAQLNGGDLEILKVQNDPEVADLLPTVSEPKQQFFFSCNDQMLIKGKVTIPNVGPWFIDAIFAEGAELAPGKVTVRLDDLTFIGTIKAGGIWADQRKVKIVGGNGSWGEHISSRHYHNDAGVKARSVASDAATIVGESINFPKSTSLGKSWTREAGTASKCLESVIGDQIWYVDYSGVTQVGTRVEIPAPSDVEILEFDTLNNRGVLTSKKASSIKIGIVLSAHLSVPAIVREIEFTITETEFRARVSCASDLKARSILANLFEKIATRATDKRLLGTYHYRVTNKIGDRVKLQAVDQSDDLPDASPVTLWTGLAGSHVELKPGVEVAVQFLNGIRSKPIISGFIGKGGNNWIPDMTHIGGTDGTEAARKGDMVTVIMTPMSFIGTLLPPGGSPTPIVGTMSPTVPTLPGTIATGSPKVKIGNGAS